MANNIIKTLAIMLMAMITGTACEAGENNGNDKKKSLTVVKLQHGINEAAEIHAAFDSRGVKWNEIDCLGTGARTIPINPRHSSESPTTDRTSTLNITSRKML